MMAHPAVQQRVNFAVPPDTLGADIAAAVVAREGQSWPDRALILTRHAHTRPPPPRRTDAPPEAAPQACLSLSVKPHPLRGLAAAANPLLGERATLFPAVNGVPWWYFYKHGGPYEGTRLQ